jgi:beta-lysine 5,6-aminomutase beta subunit
MSEAKKVNLKKIKPYGDILDDGTVQVSFTLPVEVSPEAREAAVQFAKKMGLNPIKVATMEKAGEGFSFFVIYGNLSQTIDFTSIKVLKVDALKRSRDEIDEVIKQKIGRKLKVLGACTGYDAHTVGIDAIINMKGFAGDYGLERYQGFDARNLGAQVPNEELLNIAVKEDADAILVSKVVTQHNIHLKDLKDLVAQAKKRGLADKLIMVAGGPRVTHPMALECGFDAGFGVGTKPSDVASYIVDEFLRRKTKAQVGAAGSTRKPVLAALTEKGSAQRVREPQRKKKPTQKKGVKSLPAKRKPKKK